MHTHQAVDTLDPEHIGLTSDRNKEMWLLDGKGHLRSKSIGAEEHTVIDFENLQSVGFIRDIQEYL